MKINGSARNDTLFGGAGSDLLAGKGGDDIVFGYAGDDRLWGGRGDDYIEGGDGYDTLRGMSGNDTLIGGDGHALLDGGTGNDFIMAGQNFSFLIGGDGDDALIMAHGVAYGDSGDDRFFVGEWDDFGWQALSTDPKYADFAIGPTGIVGGAGADSVDMAFRLGEDGMEVNWTDYTAGEKLTLQIWSEDGFLIADDATTKDWLDTNDDGMLSDADGDGVWLDVSFDAEQGFLTIQVDNDSITLKDYPSGLPVEFLVL